jgi:hypothetical protein
MAPNDDCTATQLLVCTRVRTGWIQIVVGAVTSLTSADTIIDDRLQPLIALPKEAASPDVSAPPVRLLGLPLKKHATKLTRRSIARERHRGNAAQRQQFKRRRFVQSLRATA